MHQFAAPIREPEIKQAATPTAQAILSGDMGESPIAASIRAAREKARDKVQSEQEAMMEARKGFKPEMEKTLNAYILASAPGHLSRDMDEVQMMKRSLGEEGLNRNTFQRAAMHMNIYLESHAKEIDPGLRIDAQMRLQRLQTLADKAFPEEKVDMKESMRSNFQRFLGNDHVFGMSLEPMEQKNNEMAKPSPFRMR